MRRHEREGLSRGEIQRRINLREAMWCKPTPNFDCLSVRARFQLEIDLRYHCQRWRWDYGSGSIYLRSQMRAMIGRIVASMRLCAKPRLP